MAVRKPVSWMQTRLGALSLVFGANGAFTFGTALVYLSLFLVTLYYYIPLNTFTPPDIYPADQNATPLGSLTVDASGRSINYTLGASVNSSSSGFVAGGEAVELITINDTIIVRLKDRGVAPGAYFMPDVNVTSEGVLTGIQDGTPVDASDVTHGAGTVADALAAGFLVAQASPDLTGERVMSPDAGDFDVDISTPGQYVLSVEPSAVANQVCTHPTSIALGAGTQTDACTSGPAPGTPGGAATLGGDGNIPAAQLPITMNLAFRGLWDPSLNEPALANASCGASDRFYYFVSAPGNVSLGTFFQWTTKELVICENGTWSKVDGIVAGLTSFKARVGDVDAEFGDYTSDLVPIFDGTLETLGLVNFVVAGPAPTLTNSQLLTGTPGEIVVSGATVGLADVPALGGVNNSFPGLLRDVCIDGRGRITCGDSISTYVEDVVSPDITVVGTENVVLSLPQGTATTSSVQFGTVTINGTTILGAGTGTATIPNVGDAQFMLTAGAKTVLGSKTFTSTVNVDDDQGIQLNNLHNNASVTLLHASSGSGIEFFRYPTTMGAAGNVLSTDGAGNTAWQTATTPLAWVPFTPSISLFFNVDPPGAVVSAYYRGAGTVGSLMEVRVTLDLTTLSPFSRWAVSTSLPVGVISVPTDGRTIGYCTVDGGVFTPRVYGWVSDYIFDNTVVYMGIEEQNDLALFGLWVCRYAYVVAAP